MIQIGRSHGIEVMGEDSCSRGLEFKCQHQTLGKHFHICFKNCIVCLKRSKMNEKESGDFPFLKKQVTQSKLL